MSKDFVRVNSSYGGLHPGIEYGIIEEGRDWIKISHNGRAIYVPLSCIENEKEYQRRIRDERWEAMQDRIELEDASY